MSYHTRNSKTVHLQTIILQCTLNNNHISLRTCPHPSVDIAAQVILYLGPKCIPYLLVIMQVQGQVQLHNGAAHLVLQVVPGANVRPPAAQDVIMKIRSLTEDSVQSSC